MRGVCRIALMVGAVVLMANVALAQPRGFPGGQFGRGGESGTQLLRNKSVQEELKLKEDQLKKLEDVEREIREKMREETYKAMAKLLDADQLKRFKEIELQRSLQTRGADIFADPNVASSLKLSDEQKDKIKTITDDTRKDMREAMQGVTGGNFQEAMQKVQSLRKESLERATSVLTKDQQKSWKELTGADFEYKPDTPMFRRGGDKPAKPQRNN